MAENQDTTGGGESSDAQIKAAFLRLGVAFEDEGSTDSETVIAALNGVADRMEVLSSERLKFETDLVARDGELQEAQAENAGLKRQVAAHKGQATKARAEHTQTAEQLAAALERQPDEVPARKLPEDLPELDKGDVSSLLDLVGSASKVEVVAFMEGTEALGVPPLTIGSDVPVPLRVGLAGVVLGVERWEVTGPAVIDGWALYLDGELAAYRHRDAGQLTIGNHQVWNLADDVLL